MRRPILACLMVGLTLGAVTACSGSASPPAALPATPTTPAPVTPAPVSAPVTTAPVTPDVAACRSAPGTAVTVRDIAAAAGQGPVLPAAVDLFLLDARQKAAASGIADPALAAAEAGMVAAIDDLDAQGKAGLPPGGNPVRNAVKIDPTRALAAVVAVEKACTALGR